MKGAKRPRRRQRAKAKHAYWGDLDRIALEKIQRSFIASSASWGGTRCPGCGISVRPSWVIPWSVVGEGFHMVGQEYACTGIGRSQVKCPGVRDW